MLQTYCQQYREVDMIAVTSGLHTCGRILDHPCYFLFTLSLVYLHKILVDRNFLVYVFSNTLILNIISKLLCQKGSQRSFGWCWCVFTVWEMQMFVFVSGSRYISCFDERSKSSICRPSNQHTVSTICHDQRGGGQNLPRRYFIPNHQTEEISWNGWRKSGFPREYIFLQRITANHINHISWSVIIYLNSPCF